MLEIHHGDCLEVMRRMQRGTVDAVITDPPYSSGTRREASKGLRKSMNRGTEAEEWFTTDCLTTQGFTWLMRECALEWKRLLKPGGHVLIFIDWRMAFPLAAAVESADFRQIGILVWDKMHFGMGNYFRNQHEFILHFTNGKSLPPQRRDTGNVIACKPVRNGDHPTEKPLDLCRRLVSVVCPKGGVILDTFCGSGAVGEAAVRENCGYIGIDNDRAYCDLARVRVGLVQPSLNLT